MNVEPQISAAPGTPGNDSHRRRHRGQRPPKRHQGANTEVTNANGSETPSEGPAEGAVPTQTARRTRNRRNGPRTQTVSGIASSESSAAITQANQLGSATNATSTPQVTPSQSSSNPRPAESLRGRRGRGSRGGRERNRQPRSEPQSVAPQNGVRSRAFGAQLTGEPSEPAQLDGASDGHLRADAPSFQPGRPAEVSRPGTSASDRGGDQASSSRRNRNSRARRGGKGARGGHYAAGTRGLEAVNNAYSAEHYESLGPEDIMTRIHREIDTGNYECMVCYNNVTRRSKIWYCRCCWSVYHHQCVQKWAKQGLDTPPPPNRPVGADGEPPRTWRCPACNDPNERIPDLYTCWCEKSIQPEQSRFLPPHSCGQTCGKQRGVPKDCPHACDLQCHAGPCLPCNSLGPSQPCYCGREETQRRCVDTDYENGWSCGRVCGDTMPCGEHECQQPCHPGLCGVCEVTELLQCYCGNEMKDIRCCDKEDPKESSIEEDDGEVNRWDGYYSCGKTCERPYDCGEHRCQKPCHTQEAKPAHCPLSPDVITHCPCGKTALSDILPEPRSKCTDPIPCCKKQCGKRLKCGHICQEQCHEGPCRMCLQTVEIACRCGKTFSRSLCHQGDDVEPPMCMRNCRVSLNCGRHECGAKCCSGEQKAQECLAAKKKSRAFSSAPTPGLQTDDGFEPEHICTRPCGRPLKCGQHNCPMLCHRGPCGTCLEASFEELACNCGRTVIQPPVPCGSKPPACRFPCTREKACGHPAVPHDCHPDDEPCPKCPYLTEKLCTCGKKTVKAVPCFRDVVSCGTQCGKKLSCGSHVCHLICHNGRCAEPCKQACGKPRSVCGHGCQEPCHAPFQCSEDKPCGQKVTLQCACGGLKQDIKCGSTKANPEGNKKELKCTDACRSRRLAKALDLDPDRESEPPYSEDTMSVYSKDKKWCTAIEEKLRSFASKSDSQRLQFQPMRKPLREFIHLLATDYGLESESQDPEPYRAVRVKKTPAFNGPPKKTLAQFLASQPASALGTPSTSGLQQLKKPRGQAVNAFILQSIRVGILANELEKELLPILGESQLRFNSSWHGDEDVLLLPKTSSLGIEQIESELRSVAPKLKRLIATKTPPLAESVELCWVGQDGRIANREGERWSLVNNRKSAPAASFVGQAQQKTRNRFDMTPLPKAEKKKKPEKPREVVDSWEMEAEEDEIADAAKTAEASGSVGNSLAVDGAADMPERPGSGAPEPAKEDDGSATDAASPPTPVDVPGEAASPPEAFYEALEKPLPCATPSEEAM